MLGNKYYTYRLTTIIGQFSLHPPHPYFQSFSGTNLFSYPISYHLNTQQVFQILWNVVFPFEISRSSAPLFLAVASPFSAPVVGRVNYHTADSDGFFCAAWLRRGSFFATRALLGLLHGVEDCSVFGCRNNPRAFGDSVCCGGVGDTGDTGIGGIA